MAVTAAAVADVAAALELARCSTSRAAAEAVTAICTGAGGDGKIGCAGIGFTAASAFAPLILRVLLEDAATPEPPEAAASACAARAAEA